MSVRLFDHRTVLLAVTFVLAFGSSGCIGCGGEPERPALDLLRARFPEQAALVLEGKRAFTSSEGGFVLRAQEPFDAMWGGAAVDLPRRGTGFIHISLPGGFEVRVRESGLHDAEGTLAENAVTYRRAGGSSFWTATTGGIEEWLHVDAGVARADEALAAWEVEGAALRLSHDVVEVVDGAGFARLHVSAPIAYAPGGREVAVRLGVRDKRIELFVDARDARGEELLIDPSWVAAGPLNVGRYYHTATTLQSGKVLVAGGITTGSAATKFVEIYDPATNIWTFGASLGTARFYHAASLLSDGKVLVTGGVGGSVFNTGEVYDPVANTWTPTAGNMTTPRELQTSTTLPNGKVLVAAGYNGSAYVATCELYDPATNTFSATGGMTGIRGWHTATLLGNGKVLVAGGNATGSGLATAQLYDPAAGTWSNAPSMTTGRTVHAATLLGNGKVLVSGGNGPSNYLTLCELYDPAANAWALTGSMLTGRYGHTSTLLGNGQVLVAGGTTSPGTSAELYDPATTTWSVTASMATGRVHHTAALLSNGKAIVMGGNGAPTYLTSAELYTGPSGISCAVPGDCVSGFCVDGYCCDTTCGGGVQGDCEACNLPGAAGTCTLVQAGTQCRAPSGVCDVAESCTGSGTVCPVDQLAPAGSLCRAAVSLCDAPESCTGNNAACPADLFAPVGTLCRSSAGDCDVAETCTGGAACPPDAFLPVGTQCRAAQGVCDVEEKCAGAAGCPVDGKAPNGTPCTDGNACTQTDTCQAGVCSSGAPVTCVPLDSCHAGGVCDPMTGICSNPVKSDGSPCNDGSACTQTDLCQAGICLGSNPVVCSASDACHIAGMCNPQNGVCSNPPKADGSPCSDGSACTLTDTCQSGVCAGGNPVVCPQPDACHNLGVCNAATGVCTNPAKADGTACNDGNACTQADACQVGVCVAGSPVVCAPLDNCHVAGVCNPQSGLCTNPASPDGVVCDDGNLCTQADACKSGLCLGGNVVSCLPVSPCHNAGACNPMTGVCSNPAKPDGAACDDGDLCTQAGMCQFGVCAGQTPVVCSASDDCHVAGVCAPGNGICSNPAKPDGAPCAGGVCMAGVCNPLMDGGSGSGGGTSASSSSSSSASSSTGMGGSSSSSSSSTGMGGSSSSSAGKGGSSSSSTEKGASSSSSGGEGGGGPVTEPGGCGCVTAGSRAGGAGWMALGLLLLIRRRRFMR